MEIQGPLIAEVCREVGAKAATPVAREAACAPVRRISVSPGLSKEQDLLPPALQSDPMELLTYHVQIFNSMGHSAGRSAGAFAAAGSVPPKVELLRATASERGAIIEWHAAQASDHSSVTPSFVDLWRTNLSAVKIERQQEPTPAAKSGRFGKGNTPDEEPGVVQLRATENGMSSPGAVDSTAAMGETYSYVAERVRRVTIGNQSLELRSAPSAGVTLAMQDTFPPKIPVGLAAISGFAAPANTATKSGQAEATIVPLPYVDLSWEANGEPDLAGYRVYRQLARPDGTAQGPLARLTASPLTSPGYRDVAVKAGQGYIYTVTAVDAAGNESAPSAKALEVVSSENGGSSSLLSPPPADRVLYAGFRRRTLVDVSARRHKLILITSQANDKGA